MHKIFDITNKYIILATPLILYSLFSSIYLVLSMSNQNLLNLFFAMIVLFLMFSAFIAGWFNMIKIAVLEQDRSEPNTLIKEFPAGVGEYFLSTTAGIAIIFLIIILFSTIAYLIGLNTIGEIKISGEALYKAMENTDALKNFLSTLAPEEMIKLKSWNLLILSTLTFTYFSIMFYLPEIFFNSKNTIKALFTSIKNLFSKKIFKNIIVFLIIFIINFILSVFSVIFNNSVLMHFIITLANFYFITAAGVGIFYYYHKNFIEPHIGQNIDIKI